MALSLISCSKFDDSDLWSAINRNSSEIAALKEQCNRLNGDVADLQQLVSALAAGDCITDCIALTDGTGYTLVFKSGKTVMINCNAAGQNGQNGQNGKDGKDGIDGKDGKDGQDGSTPSIGVAQDTDGNWYWTLDGEWLLDDSGNKVKANGTDGKDGRDGADAPVPMFKIENGMWNISLDGGASWTEIGKATGEDGKDGRDGEDGAGDASFFKDVIVGAESITFVLADGSAITLPFNPSEQASPAITGECANVDDESAEITGWCKMDGSEGLSVVFGIEYSATDLTTDASQWFMKEKDAEGKFVCRISGLKAETKYYYRAFAYFNGTYYFGDVKTFTTTKSDGGDPPTPGEIVNVTVAEFVAAPVDPVQNYRLKGKVKGPINTKYGNFDIVDETGSVYVYGTDNFDKYASEFVEGGIVTFVGKRGEYNGKIEVLEGWIEYYEAPQSGDDGGDDDGDDGGETGGVSWSLGQNATDVEVIANGTKFNGLKLGSSKNSGEAKIIIPAGAKSLKFCCVGWNGKPSEVEITDGAGNVISTIEPASNAGAKENPPFTLTVSDSDYYTISLSGQTTLIVRTTSSGPRAIFFDFTAV